MCNFSPDVPDVQPVPDRAASRLPDGSAAKTAAGRRTGDRVRSGANTILTSGSGVSSMAQTSGKTLLGQ